MSTDILVTPDQEAVRSTLFHYAQLQKLTPVSEKVAPQFRRFLSLSFSAKDSTGYVWGGVSGWIRFDFASIEVIWVDPAQQRKGFATRLLREFEKKAIEAGCRKLLTSTNDQSHEFWLKNGFEIFSKIEGSEDSVSIYHLKKEI